MNSFKDLGIQTAEQEFKGEKIDIDRILNVKIIVESFKIGPSKKKENTQYLTMQIKRDGEDRVVFTGSVALMNTIQKVPKDKFPFETTIMKNDKKFRFT